MRLLVLRLLEDKASRRSTPARSTPTSSPVARPNVQRRAWPLCVPHSPSSQRGPRVMRLPTIRFRRTNLDGCVENHPNLNGTIISDSLRVRLLVSVHFQCFFDAQQSVRVASNCPNCSAVPRNSLRDEVAVAIFVHARKPIGRLQFCAGCDCSRRAGRIGQQRMHLRAERHGEADRNRQLRPRDLPVAVAVEARQQSGQLLPLAAREPMVSDRRRRVATADCRRSPLRRAICVAAISAPAASPAAAAENSMQSAPRSIAMTLGAVDTAAVEPANSGPTARVATRPPIAPCWPQSPPAASHPPARLRESPPAPCERRIPVRAQRRDYRDPSHHRPAPPADDRPQTATPAARSALRRNSCSSTTSFASASACINWASAPAISAASSAPLRSRSK